MHVRIPDREWNGSVWCAVCLGLAAGTNIAFAQTTSNPTFSKDVARIVFENCTSCHQDGNVGPFALVTYEDFTKRSEIIRHVVAERQMPPWKATPGFGSFKGERSLSKREMDILLKWIDSGMEEGDPTQLPKPPKESPDGWPLGTPDLILEMPEFQVPPDGNDVYRCFVLPIPTSGDMWISAIDFQPGNRRVVHHALFFLDGMGQARLKDAADPEPGYATGGGLGFLPMLSLGGWAPGALPLQRPTGVARPIPANADLVVQMHYHPSGKSEKDASKIGLYFSKRQPKRMDIDLIMGSLAIDIPPGEPKYRVTDSLTLPIDVEVIGIVPHAHYLGKEIRVTARPRTGREIPMLWIKDWDFNWQEQYQYARPLRLKAGTRIDVTFTYDNSADNPNNPSQPPKRVTFGEETTDEMALLWMQVVPKNMGEFPLLVRTLQEKLFGQLAGKGGINKDQILRALGGQGN